MRKIKNVECRVGGTDIILKRATGWHNECAQTQGTHYIFFIALTAVFSLYIIYRTLHGQNHMEKYIIVLIQSRCEVYYINLLTVVYETFFMTVRHEQFMVNNPKDSRIAPT